MESKPYKTKLRLSTLDWQYLTPAGPYTASSPHPHLLHPSKRISVEWLYLHIIHTNLILRIPGTSKHDIKLISIRHRLEKRPRRIPHPRRADRTPRRHAALLRLERVRNLNAAVVVHRRAELVVRRDAVVLPGADVHGLREGFAAGAVGEGPGREERGEGVLFAAG